MLRVGVALVERVLVVLVEPVELDALVERVTLVERVGPEELVPRAELPDVERVTVALVERPELIVPSERVVLCVRLAPVVPAERADVPVERLSVPCERVLAVWVLPNVRLLTPDCVDAAERLLTPA